MNTNKNNIQSREGQIPGLSGIKNLRNSVINELAEATATYHPAKWHSITPFMSVSRKKLCGTALLESVRRRLQTRRARIKLREVFLKLHADYLLKLLSQGRYDFRFTEELDGERVRENFRNKI